MLYFLAAVRIQDSVKKRKTLRGKSRGKEASRVVSAERRDDLERMALELDGTRFENGGPQDREDRLLFYRHSNERSSQQQSERGNLSRKSSLVGPPSRLSFPELITPPFLPTVSSPIPLLPSPRSSLSTPVQTFTSFPAPTAKAHRADPKACDEERRLALSRSLPPAVSSRKRETRASNPLLEPFPEPPSSAVREGSFQHVQSLLLLLCFLPSFPSLLLLRTKRSRRPSVPPSLSVSLFLHPSPNHPSSTALEKRKLTTCLL
ncbi:hypothetical protein BDY24DRAFT_128236 [Mrakia frigida]|uniref:uncharacterized protein n=1 Tax=Mrakia frigida TaxID=29902 RepID=UPI003FCBF65D